MATYDPGLDYVQSRQSPYGPYSGGYYFQNNNSLPGMSSVSSLGMGASTAAPSSSPTNLLGEAGAGAAGGAVAGPLGMVGGAILGAGGGWLDSYFAGKQQQDAQKQAEKMMEEKMQHEMEMQQLASRSSLAGSLIGPASTLLRPQDREKVLGYAEPAMGKIQEWSEKGIYSPEYIQQEASRIGGGIDRQIGQQSALAGNQLRASGVSNPLAIAAMMSGARAGRLGEEARVKSGYMRENELSKVQMNQSLMSNLGALRAAYSPSFKNLKNRWGDVNRMARTVAG